jgi:hypothetical protein
MGNREWGVGKRKRKKNELLMLAFLPIPRSLLPIPLLNL